MALTSAISAGFDLEDLDQFGSLDKLPFSLDDDFWATDNIRILGSTVSPTGTLAIGRLAFFGGPYRSVSPTGTYIRNTWTVGPGVLRSLSPGSTRFNIPLVMPGLLRSVSPGSSVFKFYMGISPLGRPLRFVSPGSARAWARFRGHGWITRAV